MPQTFTKAGYQLVLTRIEQKRGGVQFRPEKVFTLYLAPTSVSLSPRKAHIVTPLMYGAHIDTGIQILGDLQLRISTGARPALSSDSDGNPVVFTGLERAEALRDFLSRASSAIYNGTHRMEFHSDVRNIHLIVVPATEEERMDVGSISRVGGADFSLQFVVVGEVADGVSLFGAVDSFFSDAMQEIKRATGATALTLSLLKDGINQLSNISRATIGSLIDQGRVLLDEIDGVTKAGRNLASLPFEATADLSEFADEVRATFGSDEVVGSDVIRLSEEIDAVWFAQDQALSQSSFAPGTEVTDGIGLTKPCSEEECATIVSDLEGQGDSLADKVDNEGVFSPALQSAMSSYTGWIPQAANDGESLLDAAQKAFGNANLWMDIASINGLSGPYPPPGMVLKIPVTSGGFPFSWGDPAELEEFLKDLEIRLYYRDMKLRDMGKAGVDWEIDRTGKDVATISGRGNYAQRYRLVVFKTELGSNFEFPGVGVFLGIGQKRLAETFGLTYISARQQLLVDPRTVAVITRRRQDTADGALIDFGVETVPITVETYETSLLLEV